jgi:3-phosphoglycerate kinase
MLNRIATTASAEDIIMAKLSIRELDLKDKKALTRVDFNVPLENGKITDDTRIRAALPTIQYILDQQGAVILMSHLGRPDAKYDARYSLTPCAHRLAELLNCPVQMAPDCRGPAVKKMAHHLKSGEILLLENLRFHKGEEKPEEETTFVSSLAELGDVYIDDAFGCAHRAHASTTALAYCFPGKAATGFLMEEEINYLGEHLMHPARPFCVILGGAKISTKFQVIQAFKQRADQILIGGAMAYTFFKSQNISTGHSLVENNFLNVALELLEVDTQSRSRLLLPVDLVVAQEINPKAETRIIKVKDGIPDGFEGVDIGPETIQLYKREIEKAATIFWNGPMGVFECPPFDHGTNMIAMILAGLPSAITIAGGGDSIAAIHHAGVGDYFSHLSTGGGAALEFVEFGHLPGIDALSDSTLPQPS